MKLCIQTPVPSCPKKRINLELECKKEKASYRTGNISKLHI
jgi:hypothetical protein